MTELIALHPAHHRKLRVDPDQVEAHSASVRMMPVVISEFLKAATQFPLLLTKNADSGFFTAIALCGFEEGENLFWRQGEWDALYVPLNVQRQPFFAGRPQQSAKDRSDTGHDFVLCIDPESPSLGSEKGEALFDAAGAPTPYLQSMQDILAQLVAGEAATRAFIEKLVHYKLLTRLALEITLDDGEQMKVQGVYTIDEDALEAAPIAVIDELRQQGHLPALYAMIVSLGHIFALVQRKNKMMAQAGQWFQPDPAQSAS
ncbi:peptidase [Iodidimonas nitroreducens]|uniref:Peptidase n=1 Tax=Iodidimonas nitroreducens TaxID=1236968 RepID=A0A5A7NCV2_9PROT|nr:SapC family protein [Iodidimonas nitroreducens]GAK33807.1 sapC [alpha proteobacterium Q-1]GER04776.1 peptidase [Iodidimonas nitroreducens]